MTAEASPAVAVPPVPRAARELLAGGPFLRTERWGDVVVRRGQPWCPPALARRLVGGLIRRGRLFGAYLPVPALRPAVLGGDEVAVQPYLAGAVPLRRLGPAELAAPRVAATLDRFWAGAERCWQETGWLPDIGGRVYLPWELYQPLRSDNVLVDAARRCWLVDPGATALFHCARWPTARLHAALMLAALRRARRALPRPPAAPGGR